MNEIEKLQPQCIWRNFYALTQVPRPSGHVEKIQQYLLDFAKRVGATPSSHISTATGSKLAAPLWEPTTVWASQQSWQ